MSNFAKYKFTIQMLYGLYIACCYCEYILCNYLLYWYRQDLTW